MILFYIVAQVVAQTQDWWDTPVGQRTGLILSVFASIAIIAGGVVGVRTLWTHWRMFDGLMIERRRRDQLLDQLLSKDGWPNGANNIIEAHRDLYDKVAQISLDVNELRTAVEQAITNNH